MKLSSTFIPCLLFTVTFLSWGNSIVVYFKAVTAQILINNAWEKTLEGNTVKPWPWADTSPIAKMIVDTTGKTFIVLSGGRGNALAFGPAHLEGTQFPGKPGTSIIAGHRDTHFAFLQASKKGDQISIQTLNGFWSRYEITDMSIHDTQKSKIWEVKSEQNQLLLITCYPFHAINPGGPLRLVVTLRPLINLNSIPSSIFSPKNRFISSLK